MIVEGIDLPDHLLTERSPAVLYRIHDKDYTPLFFGRTGTNRFDTRSTSTRTGYRESHTAAGTTMSNSDGLCSSARKRFSPDTTRPPKRWTWMMTGSRASKIATRSSSTDLPLSGPALANPPSAADKPARDRTDQQQSSLP